MTIESALTPTGYSLLLKPLAVETVTEGGIILPDQVQNHEQMLCQAGEVMAMGRQCYDHEKFKGERWCEIGDIVLHGQYVGTVIESADEIQYRMINDDEVKAVIHDPAFLKRKR